jgi:hypothetical protein
LTWNKDPVPIFVYFPTSKEGGGLGAPDTDFSRAQWAFTTDQAASKGKPEDIQIRSAITLTQLNDETFEYLRSQNIKVSENRHVSVVDQTRALAALLLKYKAQTPLANPISFKALPSKEGSKKKAAPKGPKRPKKQATKKATKKKIQEDSPQEDEDVIDTKPTLLTEEQLAALSPEEAFNIWADDPNDTLQVLLSVDAQNKIKKGIEERFSKNIDVETIKKASSAAYSGLKPIHTAFMVGYLGSSLRGTKWDTKVSLFLHYTTISDHC